MNDTSNNMNDIAHFHYMSKAQGTALLIKMRQHGQIIKITFETKDTLRSKIYKESS